jgi:hypothetical protein
MITYQNKQSITLIFDKYWNGELKIEIKRDKTKKKIYSIKIKIW